jgi:hypothetical protein
VVHLAWTSPSLWPSRNFYSRGAAKGAKSTLGVNTTSLLGGMRLLWGHRRTSKLNQLPNLECEEKKENTWSFEGRGSQRWHPGTRAFHTQHTHITNTHARVVAFPIVGFYGGFSMFHLSWNMLTLVSICTIFLKTCLPSLLPPYMSISLTHSSRLTIWQN